MMFRLITGVARGAGGSAQSTKRNKKWIEENGNWEQVLEETEDLDIDDCSILTGYGSIQPGPFQTQKEERKGYFRERYDALHGDEKKQIELLASAAPKRGLVHGLLTSKTRGVKERFDEYFANQELNAIARTRDAVAKLDPLELRLAFITKVAENSGEHEDEVLSLFHARCPKLNTVTREDLLIALTRVINSSKMEPDGKKEVLKSLLTEVSGVVGCLPGTLNHH